MNQQPIADIVGLCVVLAAMIFSQDVAAVVGPYLVIFVAAAIGASFRLGRSDKTSRTVAFISFSRSVGIAVMLTVGAAAIVSSVRPDLHERLLLAPIAIVLAWLDWPAFLRRAVVFFWASVDTMRGNSGKDAQ